MSHREEHRSKGVNKSKISALEKIRLSRKTGTKCKYEIEEEPSVFKYVDEITLEEVEKPKDLSTVIETDYPTGTMSPLKKPKRNEKVQLPVPSVGNLKDLFVRKIKTNSSQNFTNLNDIDDDPLLNDILKSLNTSPGLTPKPTSKKVENIEPPKLSTPKIPNNITLQEQKETKIVEPTIQPETKLNVEPVSVPNLKAMSIEIPKESKAGDCLQDLHIPSFDISDFSNGFSDIEGQIMEQNLNLSSISNDISMNTTSNFNIFSALASNDDKKYLPFFLLDVVDQKDNPNTVFLFGKVKVNNKFVSCMVQVNGVPNQFFILPNLVNKSDDPHGERISFLECYKELGSVLEKCGILKFQCKTTQMMYPFFGNDSPHIQYDFLEVLCQGGKKLTNIQGNTFQTVFGLRRSISEYFILSSKIKGPCWLNINELKVSTTKKSYCNIEVYVDSPKSVSLDNEQIDSPELLATSINLITNTGSNIRQIVGACLVTSYISMTNKIDISEKNILSTACIICPPVGGCGIPNDFIEVTKSRGVSVDITSTERSLLTLLFSKISNIDPDVIIGHDLFEYTFKFLIHCSSVQKVNIWSKIGRLKQSTLPQTTKHHTGIPIYVGRLSVELKSVTEELIKLSSYDLNSLCHEILKLERQSLDWIDINNYFTKSSMLLNLIQHSMNDAYNCLKIADSMLIIPLFKQISSICGHPISRSLTLGRAERIEYLLLHGFTESNCICPDKNFKGQKNQDGTFLQEENVKRKSAYDGGLVLDPKSGLYLNYVLLLDYMSLYPSLIQEFNICFTTMKFINKNEETVAVPIEIGDSPGVLPREIRKLVEKRRQVKGLMQSCIQNSVEYTQFEIRQRALKLIANSIYGCLGYSNSRFFARPLAALITSKGRELLGCTKDLVENLGYDVIYGDTDSIMVNTKIDDHHKIKEISQKIINIVNKNYKFLKIELDGIYRPILLLKKKKYAALSITVNNDGTLSSKKELKGLDIIRHDWSLIAKESGEDILDMILKLTNHDSIIEKIHEYLTHLNQRLNNNEIPISKFVIKKKLTKKLDEYVDKKSLSHLIVAQRLISAGKKITVGDTVEYIICIDGTNKPYTQRAYHPTEISQLDLKIDIQYYKEGQVLPIVSRLCEYVDGLESDVLSRCLDIETHRKVQYVHRSLNGNIEPLVCICEKCRTEWAIEFLLSKDHNSHSLICENCRKDVNINKLCNDVDNMVFKYCRDFYSNVYICSEPTCTFTTSSFELRDYTSNYQCECRRGHLKPKYSADKLYEQFNYLKNLFDLNKLKMKNPSKESIINNIQQKFGKIFQYLNRKLMYIMDHNAFGYVDLAEIFSTTN